MNASVPGNLGGAPAKTAPGTRAARTCVAVMIMTLAFAGAAGPPLPAERHREILRDALRAYDEAVALAPVDPARATSLFERAAADLHALRESGVRNAGLEYNLGNAHARLGQTGRAILHYRRAARIDPWDARVRDNLGRVRGLVESAATGPPGRCDSAAPGLLFATFVVCSAVGWPLMLVWLRWRKRRVLVAGLAAVAIAVCAGAALRWHLAEQARNPPAVVVDDAVMLRARRSSESAAPMSQPLCPGVELRILEQRGDWLRVRLGDGQTGWLPARSAVPV